MEKRIASLFLMDILLAFSAIGFIFVVFDLTQFAFAFELVVLLVFISLFAFGMYNAYHEKRAGWILIASILLAVIIDVIFLAVASANFGLSHTFTVFFSLMALVIALVNLKEDSKEEKIENVSGPYYNKSSAEPEKKENPKKTFEPGKYVASKKANKYHTAKCDWALRISKENRIWFNTKEDAELKGYVRDKCVE